MDSVNRPFAQFCSQKLHNFVPLSVTADMLRNTVRIEPQRVRPILVSTFGSRLIYIKGTFHDNYLARNLARICLRANISSITKS